MPSNRRNNGPTMGTAPIRLQSPHNDPPLPSARRAAERKQLLKKQEKQFRAAMHLASETDLEAALHHP
jgi:hypothetical protein